VGDEVLKFVAKNVRKIVRGNDSIARIGGEEFAVILPKTPLLGAVTVAENARASISRLKLERKGENARASISRLKLERKGKSEKLETITVSIGVSQYKQGESLEDFVNRADQALYFAKNSGRNRVSTESMLPSNGE